MKFALFKIKTGAKKKKEAKGPLLYGWAGLRFDIGEDWKNDKTEEEPAQTEEPKQERLVFVTMVDSPKEISKIIRKNPLKRYVLFRGDILDVSVSMPVFVEGKSLDSYEEEWT